LSDEFLRVARKEVAEDITEVGNLLKKCQNDNDISKNAVDVEKHIHKLKGLAPMMGQIQIGEIATLVDKLLKAVISGKIVPGIYDTVKDSNIMMQQLLSGTKVDFVSLKSQIEKNHDSFLH
jgi:chemotaxis protein histidine kinase CheA